MIETIKDLLSRRSCRSFKKEQITEEELYTILSAGIYAPSGLGKQSPRIVVMQDPVGIGHCILGYRDGEKQEPAPRKEDYVVRA